MIGGNGKGLSAFQSRGKGFELQDLERLLQHYVDWAHMLNPSVDFATVLFQINGLHKGQIVEHFSDLREAEYRRINGVDASAPGVQNNDDNQEVTGTTTAGESKDGEGSSNQAETKDDDASLSKEERIRRNREAALKRLEEKRRQKAHDEAAAQRDSNGKNSALQQEEDAEIEAMLEAEAKVQKNLHEPDMDELDALDDLLGQQDPEIQPYEPPKANATGLEPMPNENTMESISNAFRPTEDVRSESGVSDFGSTVSKSTVRAKDDSHVSDNTQGSVGQNPTTSVGEIQPVENGKPEGQADIGESQSATQVVNQTETLQDEEETVTEQVQESESQQVTQVVIHDKALETAKPTDPEEAQEAVSQQATQVVNQVENEQTLPGSTLGDAQETVNAEESGQTIRYASQAATQVDQSMEVTKSSPEAASQDQATQIVGQ